MINDDDDIDYEAISYGVFMEIVQENYNLEHIIDGNAKKHGNAFYKRISKHITKFHSIQVHKAEKELVISYCNKRLKEIDEQRERDIDRDKFDFKNKKWIYKTRFVPYIISVSAILISGFSLYYTITSTINYKAKLKEQQFELKNLENKVNTLQNQIKR